MQFYGVHADADRALCSFDEAIADAFHVGRRHLVWHRPIGAERNGRRSDDLPRILTRREWLSPLPWPPRRRFAASMGELDPKLGSPVAAAMSDDTGQARLAVIGIESEATVADAAPPLDARRFDDEQSRARIGQHAEVIEVPVGGHSVVGAVLAHGRYDSRSASRMGENSALVMS